MLAALANHMWQSTLFALLMAAATLVLRNDGAHVRYWLWWAASMKFLVPFAWLAALGGALASNMPTVLVLDEMPAAFGRAVEPVPAATTWTPLTWTLLCVWAAGFAAVCATVVAHVLRVRALLAAAAPCSDAALPGYGPRVMHTAAHTEPALVGIFRPVLLVPRGIAERLSSAQLAAVVAHELGHWRRRDNLTAAAHMLVEAVFWFHPFVWWIGRRLWAERERACDEAVVAAGHGRAVYAEAILDVCELYIASPLHCASGVSGADLEQRVTDIVCGRPLRRLHPAKRALLAAVGAGAVALPVVVGLLVGSSLRAQEDASISIQTAGEDSIPLVRIAPVYPPDALAAGLEGSVTLEFTITTDGTPADVVAVESTSPVFEQPAIVALRRWRYAPVVRENRPVNVRGVRTTIRFALARDAGPPAGGPDAAFREGDQELLNLFLGAYLPQEMPLRADSAAARGRAVQN